MTTYKDAITRIAGILGMPDGVEPDQVANVVQTTVTARNDLTAQVEDSGRRVAAENEIRTVSEGDRNRATAHLKDAHNALVTASERLRNGAAPLDVADDIDHALEEIIL